MNHSHRGKGNNALPGGQSVTFVVPLVALGPKSLSLLTSNTNLHYSRVSSQQPPSLLTLRISADSIIQIEDTRHTTSYLPKHTQMRDFTRRNNSIKLTEELLTNGR